MSNEQNNLVVARSLKVSGGSLPDGYSIRLTAEIDYSGVDTETLRGWATADRVIALQRVLRATSPEYLEKLDNPLKIHATQCGSKIVTPEQRIEELVKTGIPREAAELMVRDPQKFEQMFAKIKKG